MPLLKILNVSEWTRMSVVQNSNQFACKLAAQECARMYILGRASALFSAVSLYLHHLFSKGLRKGYFQKPQPHYSAILIYYRLL